MRLANDQQSCAAVQLLEPMVRFDSSDAECSGWSAHRRSLWPGAALEMRNAGSSDGRAVQSTLPTRTLLTGFYQRRALTSPSHRGELPPDRQTMCEDRPLVLTPARIGAEHACGRGIPGGSMDG